MKKDAKIYVAGHRGLVGSAIVKNLRQKGFTNLIMRTHASNIRLKEGKKNFWFGEISCFLFISASFLWELGLLSI